MLGEGRAWASFGSGWGFDLGCFLCFRDGGSFFGADAALREEDVGTEAEEDGTLGFRSILVMLFVTDWAVDYSTNITRCRTDSRGSQLGCLPGHAPAPRWARSWRRRGRQTEGGDDDGGTGRCRGQFWARRTRTRRRGPSRTSSPRPLLNAPAEMPASFSARAHRLRVTLGTLSAISPCEIGPMDVIMLGDLGRPVR